MPKKCTAEFGERWGQKIVCGGPVVEAADPNLDAKCAKCGMKYSKIVNLRGPRAQKA